MKVIRSRENPFFKDLRRLAASGRERKKTGLMLLDGLHLVTAYEAAFCPAQTLVASEHGQSQGEIARFLAGREYVLLPDTLFRDIASTDTPSGLLAVAAQPPPGRALDKAADTVLLDGIQDPGNLGALLRTAAAAGFRQVLLSADCAAAWSPKVLRAGQGAHFCLDIFEEADLTAFASAFAGTVAATALQEAVSLYQADLGAPFAWVFGSEGQGVRPALRETARLKVNIPMPGPVESLNVGAAAAICLFETVRRRKGEARGGG